MLYLGKIELDNRLLSLYGLEVTPPLDLVLFIQIHLENPTYAGPLLRVACGLCREKNRHGRRHDYCLAAANEKPQVDWQPLAPTTGNTARSAPGDNAETNQLVD